MKIGLLFGSFNPIHIGHLLLATYIREEARLDEIWFIVSPLNPFKQKSDLENELHRLEMVKIAVKDVEYFKVNDIEFSLPKPSYTHQTLKKLSADYPGYSFNLIIGQDNLGSFKEWKEVDWITKNYKIHVYNRTGQSITNTPKEFCLYNLPAFDISATEIRKRINNKLPIRYFVPESVEQFIRFHKLYSDN